MIRDTELQNTTEPAIAYNGVRIRDVALIRMLIQGTKPNVPYLLYAVMCWADYQH